MRTEDGTPLINGPVAADLVAALAGVNYSSVVKVMLALAAIELSSSYSFPELLDTENIPLAGALITGDAVSSGSGSRITSTEHELVKIVPKIRNWAGEDFKELRLTRFP